MMAWPKEMTGGCFWTAGCLNRQRYGAAGLCVAAAQNALAAPARRHPPSLDAAQARIARLEQKLFEARYTVGPVCRKCEIERDLGYCRCEIAANE